MQNPTWYNNQVHGCCNIAVQSWYFIIPWQHVLSCMNNAVDLSRWFQQRCSSLFVQVMNSLFQHVWTSLSITLFKLASSTMFKPVDRQNILCVFTCVVRSTYRDKNLCPWSGLSTTWWVIDWSLSSNVAPKETELGHDTSPPKLLWNTTINISARGFD